VNNTQDTMDTAAMPDSAGSGGPRVPDDRFAHVPADRATAARLARALRFGLFAASALIALGLLWQMVTSGFSTPRPSFSTFDPATTQYRSLSQTFRGLANWRPDSLTQLGVIALIALPAARVAWLLVAMASRRERLYAAICAAVLVVLVWGLVAGK